MKALWSEDKIALRMCLKTLPYHVVSEFRTIPSQYWRVHVPGAGSLKAMSIA